jgi:K+-transporting ATPase KdpF subunit
MIALIITSTAEDATGKGYIVGIIVALGILAYLIYALLKPEKF